jgi:LDH2 family malate/lactate/ureidoglycolate dehydrogenase
MPRAERLFDAILSQEGTRLPGGRRLQNRTKTVETGIHIPRTLYDSILALME